MKNKMVRPIMTLVFIFSTIGQISATEGMWIPSMIKQLVGDDMTAMGMKISADDLYNINKSCIKDAVVHFNGGCTSVLVSESGLLLTNHHCGYGRIQSHSSLENNYLKDGFWASSFDKELANPGMNATIIKEIRDVTDEVLGDLAEDATEADRKALVKLKTEEIVAASTEGNHYSAYIRPFYFGNQYLLFITEVFEDVRLVGAPPSSIGKYGYDTDNWVWPRHTGDFSVFRIYANADNKPAKYDEANVPYKPAYHLPVSLDGVDEDDFTIVYGFPGRTDNYISSIEVGEVLNQVNPMRLNMREASLGVIDAAMRKDELTKIKYAAKQSRISNAYKKWIGQTKGLVRHRAIEKKDSLELLFQNRVNAKPAWSDKYGSLLLELSALSTKTIRHDMSRNYFIEFYYYGPEILRFAGGFSELVQLSKNKEVPDEEIQKWVDDKLGKLGYFKNYDPQVDQDIMKAQIGYFIEGQPLAIFTKDMRKKNESLNGFVSRLYDQTMFVNEEQIRSFLENYSRGDYKKIEKDMAYGFSNNISNHYMDVTRPALMEYVPKQDSLMRAWMSAQMEVIPEKTYYPDANGTLRISFGKVEGYPPFDAAEYAHYTTLKGVIEKEDPTNPEYNLPPRLRELYDAKDYGQYAHDSGEMRVCFIASNHTSGGNSGSPVINAKGELIGLNFDRTWESTMSDIMFNPAICRNITVDIRYVLFIMDKFAGAEHLVKEMDLVKADQDS